MSELFDLIRNVTSSSVFQLDFYEASKLSKLLFFNKSIEIYREEKFIHSDSDFICWASSWMQPEWSLIIDDGQVVIYEEKPTKKKVLDVPFTDLKNGLKNSRPIQASLQRLNPIQRNFVAQMGISLGPVLFSDSPDPLHNLEALEELCLLTSAHLEQFWKEEVGSPILTIA